MRCVTRCAPMRSRRWVAPDGVLVVDETGFVKKGHHSVGVARQYTGTARRVENSQVGVFLAYAGRFGQALIDRRLHLPRDWAADGARRAKTSVPEEVAFATKPVLAREMIGDALVPTRVVVSRRILSIMRYRAFVALG